MPHTEDVPPVVNGGEPPFGSTSDEFETADAPLRPSKIDIERHLYELFPPAFVHPHPDAWIEIAYGNPATGGKPDEAKHFSAFDLAGAAEFAEKKNKAGFNIYVGPALRKGETGPKSKGRASDANALTGVYAWADFDSAGDYDRINDTLKDKNLRTSMLVVTGRTPHKRGHPYFKLAGGATPAELRNANTALKTLLGTDDVENPSRVMRLAGTISYPPPDKVERGYIAELVTLHIRKDAPTYTVEQLTGVTGKTSDPFGFNFNDTRKPGRNDDELEALLEASRVKNWHNNIRAAIATMIGRGWSDSAIRFTCKPYCRDGYADHDLDDLIDRGRAKWNKPDAGSNPDLNDEFGQQAKPPGIPLDYYENFGNDVAKKAIIKGVIYRGERTSWVGPPGSGKSALLVNLLIHAADGHDWRGYRSKERVGVVYFALERGQLVRRRLRAHALQPGGSPNLPIAVAGGIINLLNSSCVATIIDTIRTAEVHFGCPVGLIIIDTFNKGIAVGGGDEDKAKDQNIAAANLQQVQDVLTDVHIALVGHTGKDESRGARGSNAHMGDVDMMVQIAVADDVRTATITKINDGAEGVLTRFKLETVTLGQDEDGDDITTAIVSDDRLDTEKENSRAKLTKSQRRAMEMLERALEDGPVPIPLEKAHEYPARIKPVPIERWRTCCLKGDLSPAGTRESADRAFRRAMSDLVAMHRIGIWDGLVWIAYE